MVDCVGRSDCHSLSPGGMARVWYTLLLLICMAVVDLGTGCLQVHDMCSLLGRGLERTPVLHMHFDSQQGQMLLSVRVQRVM